MKHVRNAFYTALVLFIALVACEPKSTPIQAPPVAIEPPSLVTVPTEVLAIPTLVPIVLTGPEMKVGSTYPYVDGTLLVAVPAGPFIMGHGGSDNPEHTVTQGDFWIYSTKVTNQQYAFCVKSGQCTPPDLKDNITYTDFARLTDPVTGVTYDQSAAYCSFVHGQLPTEAQWEKTARGPNGNLYPWGNNTPICDLLNFKNCVGKTTSVIKYPQGASYYSALDMEGNTFEWVADWYDFSYYKTGGTDNPLGPDKGTVRSVRSSSYKANADQVPAAVRFFRNPNDHTRDLGFRCVVNDPTWFAPFCSHLSYRGVGTGGIKYDCPKVNVNPQPQSCKAGWTQVTVSDSNTSDPNANVSVAGCGLEPGYSIGSYPQLWKCTVETTASINSLCTFTYSGDAQCGPHYQLNNVTGECEWDSIGSIGTQCLAGFTYNPVNHCCSASAGTAGNYPLCSVGSTLFQDSPNHYICLPNNAAPPSPSVIKPVHLPPPPPCTNTSGCNPATDPNCQSGGNCPNGGTYQCKPDPKCSGVTSAGPCPPICGCQ